MAEYIVKCNEFVGVSGKTIQFPEYIDLNQEIVRCRDCRYYVPTQFLTGTFSECTRYTYDGGYTLGFGVFDDDDFCSNGERRES